MKSLLVRATYYDYDASKLLEARKSAGLSQEDVALQARVHSVTLCRIEKKRAASYEAVVRLCEFYGLAQADVIFPVDTPASLHPSRKNFLRKPTQCVESA